MRLTIEDTTDFHDDNKRKIAIEVAHDDLTMDDMIEQFIRPILYSLGYIKETIDGALGKSS